MDQKLHHQEGGSVMKRRTKIWLMIAGFLVLTGGILFAGAMSVLGWDFTRLSTIKYETNTYEISDAFRDLSLTTDTADIVFALSDDGTCKVECYEEENAKHSVAIENDTLVVSVNNQKSWYDYIGISFGSPKITVYLPKAEYKALLIRNTAGNIQIPGDYSFENVDISLRTGDVNFCASVSESAKINTNTGNIYAENTSVGSLALSVATGNVTASNVTCNNNLTVNVSTGKAYLTDLTCESAASGGSTGAIALSNVIAAKKISIERSTGNITFNRCDAPEIYAKTSTGDVTGSLLSSKIFTAQTNTGSIDVPKSENGGKCEITTSTGNIKITVE